MPDMSALADRFPTRELEVRRLRARDVAFRCACEDYELAVKALHHWERVEKNAVRAVEYRQFATEIATEIAARLDAAFDAAWASFRTGQQSPPGWPDRPIHAIWDMTNLQQEQD